VSVVLAIALQVAAQAPSRNPAGTQANASGPTQADLDGVTDTCGVPHRWLTRKKREIVFDAGRNADFTKIQCVIAKVYPMSGKARFVFIGNEQLSEKK